MKETKPQEGERRDVHEIELSDENNKIV